MARGLKAVVALGGNALLPPDERGTQREQLANARVAARRIVGIAGAGYPVAAVVHGNAPQVGNLLIQMEEASSYVPPYTLDVCVAATQGTMGFLLEGAIRNELRARRIRMEVTTVVTLVVVEEHDPAFRKPVKPVGPVLTPQRARYLRMVEGTKVVDEEGRGYRKVVASPDPVEVIPADVLRRLVDSGFIVIAGGGGGIPVIRKKDGTLAGVEAVVDKDRTAALIARTVRATHLFILTEVPCVYEAYATPKQKPVSRIGARELRRRLAAGEFPPGNMGPKIEAALDFLAGGGTEVLITSPEVLPRAMRGKAGTRIVR